MHKKEDLVAAEWEEEGLYKTTPCCLYECHSDPEKKKKRGSRRTNGRKDVLCLLLFMTKMQTLIRRGGVTGPRWMWVGGVV